MRRPFLQFMLLVLVLIATCRPAWACAVCYGEPDSPMSKGLTWAVVALAGMISLVLVAVAAFFVHVRRRTDQLAAPGKSDNSGS